MENWPRQCKRLEGMSLSPKCVQVMSLDVMAFSYCLPSVYASCAISLSMLASERHFQIRTFADGIVEHPHNRCLGQQLPRSGYAALDSGDIVFVQEGPTPLLATRSFVLEVQAL